MNPCTRSARCLFCLSGKSKPWQLEQAWTLACLTLPSNCDSNLAWPNCCTIPCFLLPSFHLVLTTYYDILLLTFIYFLHPTCPCLYSMCSLARVLHLLATFYWLVINVGLWECVTRKAMCLKSCNQCKSSSRSEAKCGHHEVTTS